MIYFPQKSVLEATTVTPGQHSTSQMCKNSDRKQQMSSHALAAPKPAGVVQPDREKAGTLTLFTLISTCLTKIWTVVVIAICVICLCCVKTVAGPHFLNIQGGNSRCQDVSWQTGGVRVCNSYCPFFSYTTSPPLDHFWQCNAAGLSSQPALKTYLPHEGQKEISADHKGLHLHSLDIIS